MLPGETHLHPKTQTDRKRDPMRIPATSKPGPDTDIGQTGLRTGRHCRQDGVFRSEERAGPAETHDNCEETCPLVTGQRNPGAKTDKHEGGCSATPAQDFSASRPTRGRSTGREAEGVDDITNQRGLADTRDHPTHTRNRVYNGLRGARTVPQNGHTLSGETELHTWARMEITRCRSPVAMESR